MLIESYCMSAKTHVLYYLELIGSPVLHRSNKPAQATFMRQLNTFMRQLNTFMCQLYTFMR